MSYTSPLHPHKLTVCIHRPEGLSYVTRDIDFPVAVISFQILEVFRVLGEQMKKDLNATTFHAQLIFMPSMQIVADCTVDNGKTVIHINKAVSASDGTLLN